MGIYFPAGGVRRGDHLAFHLPCRRNPSSGKPYLSQIGMINAIENLHQFSVMRTWRTFVEQLQLRNAGAGDVIQHYTGFAP